MSEKVWSEEAPVHPIEVRISIGADDAAGLEHLIRLLEDDLADLVKGQIRNRCSGGYSGSYSITSATRDITADEYRAELLEWAERSRNTPKEAK